MANSLAAITDTGPSI